MRRFEKSSNETKHRDLSINGAEHFANELCSEVGKNSFEGKKSLEAVIIIETKFKTNLLSIRPIQNHQ